MEKKSFMAGGHVMKLSSSGSSTTMADK